MNWSVCLSEGENQVGCVLCVVKGFKTFRELFFAARERDIHAPRMEEDKLGLRQCVVIVSERGIK